MLFGYFTNLDLSVSDPLLRCAGRNHSSGPAQLKVSQVTLHPQRLDWKNFYYQGQSKPEVISVLTPTTNTLFTVLFRNLKLIEYYQWEVKLFQKWILPIPLNVFLLVQWLFVLCFSDANFTYEDIPFLQLPELLNQLETIEYVCFKSE